MSKREDSKRWDYSQALCRQCGLTRKECSCDMPAPAPPMPVPEVSLPQLLTLNEVADHLRVHPTTIRRLLRNRQIPAFKISTDWRFSLRLIQEWEAAKGTPRANRLAKGEGCATIPE
jgi:excisionase family DNA binding protein